MKTTPWIVIQRYCACRCIEGGSQYEPADRVAFIEKSPRVRIAPWPIIGDKTDSRGLLADIENWKYGPKGPGGPDGHNPGNGLYGFCQASRDWCDEQLKAMGYELT